MRKSKGPSSKEEWEEALKGSLTGAKAQYLKCGKLKKCDYKTLLNRINGYVIDNLNAALKLFENGSEELTENLYRLRILADTVQNICFFKHLDFIKKQDGEDIERRIKDAVSSFVGQIEIPVENENADLIYYISALKKAAGLQSLV